jgi:hypothetical protein
MAERKIIGLGYAKNVFRLEDLHSSDTKMGWKSGDVALFEPGRCSWNEGKGPRIARIYADEWCRDASARGDKWVAAKDTEDAEDAEKNISGPFRSMGDLEGDDVF